MTYGDADIKGAVESAIEFTLKMTEAGRLDEVQNATNKQRYDWVLHYARTKRLP